MNKILGFKIANLVMFIGTFVVNYLTTSNTDTSILRPIGNVSNDYDTLITPPSWAFSFWGVIYAGLLIFNIAQFIPQLKLDGYVKRISYLFILSCLFNITWILAFSIGTKISILISVFLIFGLLISLLLIQWKCDFFSQTSTPFEVGFGDIPFSIYLGWVITASILNVFVCIRAWIGHITDENIWYIIIILVTCVLYLLNMSLKNNYVTLIVFFYVLVSLAIKHFGDSTLFPFTVIMLCFSIFGLLMKVFLPFFKKKYTMAIIRKYRVYNIENIK